jgi:hypothetical protein
MESARELFDSILGFPLFDISTIMHRATLKHKSQREKSSPLLPAHLSVYL